MAEDKPLKDPWLVAVWPGMGNVALAAGGYLVNQLDATPDAELAANELFDIEHVEVTDGIADVGRSPRSMFFEIRNPTGDHDLLLFLGEAQPSSRGYYFCHELLNYALKRGVTRLFTFAAMASQLHPNDTPRVFAAATEANLLDELKPVDVELLKEGQISGLNGVMLAAGKKRDIPGICLLGELPYFAVGVPNPRASEAVLEVFAKLAKLDLDMTELHAQAEQMQQHLMDLMEKLSQAAQQQSENEESFTTPQFLKEADDESPEPKLDPAAEARIEKLFQKAHHDRARAMELKHELDRLGVFDQYENRFLDLFKKAD